MSHLIPTSDLGRNTRLADLFFNIATGRAGVALLSAQIADLEQRCAVMRSRLDHKRPERIARQAQPV